VRGFVGERGEDSVGGLPQSREQLDEHVERCVLLELEQGNARLAGLEQERVSVGVVVEETDGAVAVPLREGRGLVLGLAVRVLELEHDRFAVRPCRAERERGRGVRERVADRQLPPLHDLVEATRELIEPDAARLVLAELSGAVGQRIGKRMPHWSPIREASSARSRSSSCLGHSVSSVCSRASFQSMIACQAATLSSSRSSRSSRNALL
jgi:hypothetical protein